MSVEKLVIVFNKLILDTLKLVEIDMFVWSVGRES